MNGEQPKLNEIDQPDENYNTWQAMADEVIDNQPHTPSEQKPEAESEKPAEDQELTPEQIEFREGHTQEEVDKLCDDFDSWWNLNSFDGLHENFDYEGFGWKFSDIEAFNKHILDLYDDKGRCDCEGNSLKKRLINNLKDMGDILGKDSPEYKTVVAKKIFDDIRDGRYYGARLSFDYGNDSRIIFGNDDEALERDDAARERQRLREEQEWDERQKELSLKYETSWRNPKNQEQYQKNYNTLDDTVRDGLHHIVTNIGELAPQEMHDELMDIVNQGILEGRYNGAYWDRRGTYWKPGDLADDIRRGEQKAAEAAEYPTENAQAPAETQIPKTPDFGFRDW